MCPGPARKKRAPGQPFLAPGRHWNGRNVNSLQLLVPVALLGWPGGQGGHPCHPGGLPPTTWRVQHGPRGPSAARAAAPCPPNRCFTAPMQRAANAARKIHNGLFCHLGGLPQPVLEFFSDFFQNAHAHARCGARQVAGASARPVAAYSHCTTDVQVWGLGRHGAAAGPPCLFVATLVAHTWPLHCPWGPHTAWAVAGRALPALCGQQAISGPLAEPLGPCH